MAEYIKQLNQLKNKLKRGEMSVLVGAGFSKNVSNEAFPTWWQLLEDLVYFLYKEEIDNKLKKITNSEEREKVKQDNIEIYINKHGYLEIVSKYIKRKGFREAITNYIEERTPRIINDETGRKLVYKKGDNHKSVLLNSSDLYIHRMLLNLNWNNIYTTNYDTLLEESYESEGVDKLIEHKDKLYESLIKLKNEKQKIENENLELEKKINEIKLYDSDNKIHLSKIDNSLADYHQSQAENNHNLFSIDSRIEKINNELVDVDTHIHNSISVVKNSSDLSLKRNKNIIKLHGSLREEGEEYGFDNDKSLHYIISKEDYESYPKKHEAFTQLMRISLLQESFCLIGFSGDDPNFIEWIRWVRDILTKNQNTSNQDRVKIYLIDVNESDDPKDLKLYYENHGIFKIPLGNEQVKKYLKNETELTEDNEIKDRLNLFFHFLNSGEYSVPKVFLEKNGLKEYHNSWRNIDVGYKNLNPNNILKKYYSITNAQVNKKHLIFDFTNFYTNSKQRDLVHFSKELISIIDDNKEKEKFLELFLLALDNLKIPASLILGQDNIKYWISEFSSSKLKDNFNKILNLDNLIRLNNQLLNLQNNNDCDLHLKILYHIFCFEFESARKILDNWNPKKSNFIIQKSGLLSFFDYREGFKYLKSKQDLFKEALLHYQLYYYQYYNYLNPNISFKKNNNFEIITKIKSFGFNDVFEVLNHQIGSFREEKQKIEKYGKGRFSINTNFFALTKDSPDVLKASQFLTVLIDFSLPLTTNNSKFIDESKWYNIFKEVYEYYPFSAMFYSLQYSNQEFVKRISQDFIFSENLTEEVNTFLPMILKSYLSKSLPENMKKSVLICATELFVAVNPKIWESYIEKLWDDDEFNRKVFDSFKREEYDLINSATKYISNHNFIKKIILKTLTINTSNSLNLLYSLSYNLEFEKIVLNEDRFFELLNDKINLINEEELSLFFLYNLKKYLSDKQINKIRNKIQKINFEKLNRPNIWGILIYFSKDDKKAYNLIKAGIINNENLFNTGFREDGSLSHNNNLIRLTSFRKKDIKIWNKTECKHIFNKIKSEFDKIEKFNKRRSEIDFKNILEEMFRFIEWNNDKLTKLTKFEDYKSKIINLYFSQRGYKSVYEALSSKDEHDNVIWALSELNYNNIYKIDCEDFNKVLKILINRVLLANSNGLEACIACLVSLIENNESIIKENYDDLIHILNRYYYNPPEKIDKIYVEAKMITIAKSINDKTDFVKKWLKKNKESRYNYLIN